MEMPKHNVNVKKTLRKRWENVASWHVS